MTFSRREFLGAVGVATAWTITAKAEPERSANNIVLASSVLGSAAST